LRDRDGIAARALEFAILTAARSGEVRGAVWSEFDLAARVWTVPATRMKAGREHVVPLSDRAIEIIESMLPLRPRLDPDQALVFPGTRGQMSDMTLGAVLSRMGVAVTVHGFRSSFRTWGAENNVATHEALEAALAHTISNGTVAAYLRSSFFEQRLQLMDRWACFVAGGSSDDNVVARRSYPP
jgi:integrase